MTKWMTIMASVGAAVALSGCAADELSFSTTEQAVTCETMAGVYPVKAALAVAMAKEMGEIDAVKNLTVSDGKVVISATGQALCNARGGCHNTEGLLAMQDDSLRNYIDQAVFNPTSYRQDLIASFDRQRNSDYNLRLNDPAKVPEAESLVLTGTVMNNGACGTHYEFDAFKAGCGTGSSCYLTKPANEVYRLVFFGIQPDGTSGNPFIAFYSSDAGIAIDPTSTLNGGTGTTSGSCETGYTKYDPTWASRGSCCYYNGYYGSWQPAPWSYYYMYCAR